MLKPVQCPLSRMKRSEWSITQDDCLSHHFPPPCMQSSAVVKRKPLPLQLIESWESYIYSTLIWMCLKCDVGYECIQNRNINVNTSTIPLQICCWPLTLIQLFCIMCECLLCARRSHIWTSLQALYICCWTTTLYGGKV